MNSYVEPWIADVKRALDWFIELMGREEWHRRRRGVAEYFHSIDKIKYTEEDIQDYGFEKKFAPIAVYTDWISWYMYLGNLYSKELAVMIPLNPQGYTPFLRLSAGILTC